MACSCTGQTSRALAIAVQRGDVVVENTQLTEEPSLGVDDGLDAVDQPGAVVGGHLQVPQPRGLSVVTAL